MGQPMCAWLGEGRCALSLSVDEGLGLWLWTEDEVVAVEVDHVSAQVVVGSILRDPPAEL